jgi:hypothetical protein
MYTTLTLRAALLCVVLGTGISASAQNGYLTGLNIPRYIKAGTDLPLTVRARNAGGPAYNFFQVSWRLNNGTVHVMNQSVGGSGILGNNSSFLEVTHPVQLNAPQGDHVFKMWITVPGETDPGNDTLTVNFTALNAWAEKVVLMEARTETWCPQCPPANVYTNQMLSNPDLAMVKFHLSDGLEFQDAVDYYAQYNANFTPVGVLELGEYGGYTPNPNSPTWIPEMTLRAAGVSPVNVELESSLDAATRLLRVTIRATFTYALTGPFRMNVYLAENFVPGPQQNAPPDYIHHGLLRAMLGGSSGTGGVIPNTPAPGTTYFHTYSYQVPQEFKLQDLYLVGYVEHVPTPGSRYALNAVSSLHSMVGIPETADRALRVWPNPTEGPVWFEVEGMQGQVGYEVISSDGRIMAAGRLSLDISGRGLIDMGSLAPGAYRIGITDGRNRVERKVLISR